MHEYAADPGRSVDRRRFAAGSAALPRRMHPTFSFETSNAPDWYGDVRLCRTGLNPHFLFVLPKRLPGFPAELYRFGTEKPGGYSLLKRECPPRPPKEKRGGISISPRTPLKRHKGAGCGPNTVMAIRFPALMGRQSCHFLESTSLYPPPAALWCFPLWKSLPRKDGGATVEREAEDVLFATPVCEGLSGAGTH